VHCEFWPRAGGAERSDCVGCEEGKAEPDEEDRMWDLLMVAFSIAFFVVAVVYTTACTRLR